MRQDVGETPEGSLLELMRRASIDGDQRAWAAFEQGLQATVLAWLRAHPGRAVACAEQDESFLVERVLTEAWQAVRQEPLASDSLSQVLLLLRASLNRAIVEAQRVSLRPRAVGEDMAVEQNLAGHPPSSEVWDWVQTVLLSERERRLAYLLYHCGLQPAEIVRCCPQEWGDIHEVKRLRHIIFMQLIREPEH